MTRGRERLETDKQIAERFEAVRERIAVAAKRAGRSRDQVRVVLATKTQSVERLRAAYQAGAREFGENYVQEGTIKRAALNELADVRWHLIGHLQSNKVRPALKTFDLIQTLDSERLADAIARIRPGAPVLIEVNIGEEPTKSGVRPELVEALVNRAREKLEVLGLMAIAPVASNQEESQPYFSRLRMLRDRLAAKTGLALSELSMGMTDDFEVAIEEGATMVRMGRAVFGERRE